MSIADDRRGIFSTGRDPVEFAVFAFAHRATIESGDGFSEDVESGFAINRSGNDGIAPSVPAILGTQNVAAEKNEIGMMKNAFHLLHGFVTERRPAITGAQNGTIAELHHAGVLRAAHRIGVEEFGFRTPSLAIVLRPDHHELAVAIGVGVGGFAENTAVGRATKGDEEFAIGTFYDGWESGVEIGVAVEDEVLDFFESGDFIFGMNRERTAHDHDEIENDDPEIHGKK